MLAIARYATVAAMEAAAVILREKIFWSKLEYVGSGVKTEIFIDSVTPCYVELLITSLHNERKQLTGRLLVLCDITQRYQAKSELRQANEYLQKQILEIQT